MQKYQQVKLKADYLCSLVRNSNRNNILKWRSGIVPGELVGKNAK